MPFLHPQSLLTHSFPPSPQFLPQSQHPPQIPTLETLSLLTVHSSKETTKSCFLALNRLMTPCLNTNFLAPFNLSSCISLLKKPSWDSTNSSNPSNHPYPIPSHPSTIPNISINSAPSVQCPCIPQITLNASSNTITLYHLHPINHPLSFTPSPNPILTLSHPSSFSLRHASMTLFFTSTILWQSHIS